MAPGRGLDRSEGFVKKYVFLDFELVDIAILFRRFEGDYTFAPKVVY